MNITSKIDRSKLSPRREPYWSRLSKGCYIGFRKLEKGEGSWIARYRDGMCKQHYKALGEFPTYDAAVEASRGWFAEIKSRLNIGSHTVESVCQYYLEDLKKRNGQDSHAQAAIWFNALIVGKDIAGIVIDKLTPKQIRDWLNNQVKDPDEEEWEDVRKSKATANRNLASLKAALNFAKNLKLVETDSAWKDIKKFRGADGSRSRVLDSDERQRLLKACEKHFEDFVKALMFTGARPGEIANVCASNFDVNNKALTILKGKTNFRIVPVSTEGAIFFPIW